jgi:hypothetical protein
MSCMALIEAALSGEAREMVIGSRLAPTSKSVKSTTGLFACRSLVGGIRIVISTLNSILLESRNRVGNISRLKRLDLVSSQRNVERIDRVVYVTRL